MGFSIFVISNYSIKAVIADNNYSLGIELSTPQNLPDIPNTADGKIFFQKITNYTIANKLEQASMGTIVQTVAHQFLGAEYKAGLLDRSKQETLVIALKQFDCLLLIETVLAIANNIAQKNYSYRAFTN